MVNGRGLRAGGQWMRAVLAAALLAGTAVTASSTASAQAPPTPDPEGPTVTGVEEPLPAEVVDQIAAIEADKADRTVAERKISGNLLYAVAEADGGVAVEGAPDLSSSAEVDASGNVRVEITGTVDAALVRRIAAAGGAIAFASPADGTVVADVPLDGLVGIASLSTVGSVGEVGPAIVNGRPTTGTGPIGQASASGATAPAAPASVGAVANEADLTHLVAEVRAATGADGTGVKICVLSDGIGDLATSQASGELPAVDVLPGQSGFGREGTAMLELIHDLAPGASLGFAAGLNSVSSMAQNILALRASGCDVLVDDIAWFAEPTFQDGPIARAITQVRADGALYFTSAGNMGNLADGTSGTWVGDFQDAGPSAAPLPSGSRVHGWGIGQPYNVQTVSSPLSIGVLQWADPDRGSANDYDLYVLSSDGSTIVAASTTAQTGTQDPVEWVARVIPEGSRVVVTKSPTAEDRLLGLYTFGGSLSIATGSAVVGHNGTAAAISVAATPARGPFPGAFDGSALTETFTSDGPVYTVLTPSGAPVTPGDQTSSGAIVDNGVDITAADGVSTSVFGFRTFFGTSAAAPNAAAIAALALAADPTLTADEVEEALRTSAVDIEAPGVDPATGAGLVMAPQLFDTLGLLPYVSFGFRTLTDVVGDDGTALNPGEVVDITQPVTNTTDATIDSLEVTLSTSAPEVTIAAPTVTLSDLGPGETADATFRVRLASTCECGRTLPFVVEASDGSDRLRGNRTRFDLVVGSVAFRAVRASGLSTPIPDASPSGVAVSLVMNEPGVLTDVNVLLAGTECTATPGATTVGISHPDVSQLTIRLTSPAGTTVDVLGGLTSTGANLCDLTLSDSATRTLGSLTTADAPHSGSFRPVEPLSAFRGESQVGTWTLQIVDGVAGGTGTVRDVLLQFVSPFCTIVPPAAPADEPDAYSTAFGQTLTVDAPGVLANDTDANLDPITAELVDPAVHGTVTLAADGSFTYAPAAGFSGQDSFSYRADDGALTGDGAVVTIDVEAPALRGLVTDPSGAPAPDVLVLAYAPTDGFTPTAQTTTGADGRYTFPTLAEGTYALAFVAPSGAGLPVQWRGPVGSRAAATPTVIGPAGGVVADHQLVAGGALQTTVLAPGGAAATGVTLYVFPAGGTLFFPAATRTVPADGVVRVGGLFPGDYEVVVAPSPSTGWAPQWYRNLPSRTGATRVTVTSGGEAALGTIQLRSGASIAGNAGAPGVRVSAFLGTDRGTASFTVVSAADGSYRFSNLPPSNYKIAFRTVSGPLTWFGGTSRSTATRIVAADGAVITGIDR